MDPVWSKHILAIAADPSYDSLFRHVSAMIEQVRQMEQSKWTDELRRIGASLFEIGYYRSMEMAKTPRSFYMLPAPYSSIVYLGFEMDTDTSGDPERIIAKAQYLCQQILAGSQDATFQHRAALVEEVLSSLESRFHLLSLEPLHHIFCVPEIATDESVFGYGGYGWTLQMINAHPENSDDSCVIESVVRIMTDHAMTYMEPTVANKLLERQMPYRNLDSVDVWVPAYIEAIKSGLLYQTPYAERLNVVQNRNAAEWQKLIRSCVKKARSGS